tara:strand:- start:3160 stop:3642 length:483 start_codon:yes stop_codon:yes gene_type:complete
MAHSFKYTAGLHNASSFATAGTPWLSGSTCTNGKQQIMRFPNVTKSVTVINTSEDGTGYLRIHFQSGSTSNCATNGTDNAIAATDGVIRGKHFVVLSASSNAVTFDVKCKEIYVSAWGGGNRVDYTVVADLTGIPSHHMYELTGSGINHSRNDTSGGPSI